MVDTRTPRIRATATGLRISPAINRRGILFLSETDEDEIKIEEVDPQNGRLVERSRLSRQAYTDAEAIRVYRATRRRSRREGGD